MTLLGTSFEERLLCWTKSLAAHGLILLVMWLASVIGNLPLFFNSKTVTVKSAVRVDVVAMPKFTLKELKSMVKIDERPVTGKEPPAQEKMDPNLANERAPVLEEKAEQKEKKFDDFLSKLSQKKLPVDKKVKVGKPDAKNLGPEQEKIQDLVHLGNKLSKGLVTFGENVGEEVQGAIVEYGTQVTQKVKPFWRLPTYLMEKKLSCGVIIFLDRQGELIKTQIKDSSGVAEYDQRAVAALQQAAPYGTVPVDLVDVLRRGGLTIGFPL